LLLLVTLNLWGTWQGWKSEKGFTAQYNPQYQYGNQHDASLIAFLEGIGTTRGYTNYWIGPKIAFASKERVILAPLLPVKTGACYKTSKGYRPYVDRVSAADEIVYVTGNQPDLDVRLRSALDARGLSYREREVGPYRVFHDLSSPIRPAELPCPE